jgi:acetyl esterase
MSPAAYDVGSLLRRVRGRAGAFLIDNAFRTAARVSQLHPDSRPARHGVAIDRDVAYQGSGDEAHLLDVYRPASGTGPLPVVLYVHGGGFRILSKDTHWLMALAFARRGYVVFSINYRLAPRHRFPAAIEDTCRAYTWLVQNAARFGGDPEQIVLAGESAGANLITALALSSAYRRSEPYARAVFDTNVVPRACLPACGLFQVTDPGRFGRRRPLKRFLQDRLDEVSRAYLGPRMDDVGDPTLDLADPLVALERAAPPDRPLPPFFVGVGTADPILDDTRRLKAAIDRLGARCRAEYYPGELHAFHALVWRHQARRFWGHTYAFLDEVTPGASQRRELPTAMSERKRRARTG